MRCSARATGTDHPRSRGVYLFSIREAGLMPGSSPLARGLQGQGALDLLGGGDHPRSRGVYAR